MINLPTRIEWDPSTRRVEFVPGTEPMWVKLREPYELRRALERCLQSPNVRERLRLRGRG